MGLQLRRGTNAERLNITPLEGELVYTTDLKEVWVGDGSTIGGTPVTVFTSEDAQDAVASLFENGTHSGITFTYNDANNSISATVNAIGTLENLTDTDIVTPLQGDVLTYNGTKWVNSSDVGGLTSVVSDTAPQLGGNLDLNSFNIIGVGNIGITGGIITSGNITANGSARLHDLVVRSQGANIDAAITGYSITSGTDTTPGWTDLVIGKSNWTSPVNPVAGDFLGGYKISTYVSGTAKPVALFAAELTSSANTADPLPASNVYIGAATGTGITRFSFRSSGVFEAPVIKAANYTTANLPATPEKGYIVFDSTSNEFKGWNGTTWVVLG